MKPDDCVHIERQVFWAKYDEETVMFNLEYKTIWTIESDRADFILKRMETIRKEWAESVNYLMMWLFFPER